MSWQLACFGLIVLVLAAGFGWYERSRPSARLLALVAALAALAVAGRVVLAPVPNVVATTDVVLLAGYALGAAPGFAVGALAALISNFWLGQGPWTVWQMAGWGLVGIGGAFLARALGRELGRWALAAVAAAAGLAYGALLDLSVMVSYGGEQSLERYLALSARGIPFNLAHALGNAALMLAAGPALVRMLVRFRERSSFSWPGGSERVAGGVASLFVAAALIGPAIAPEPAAAAGLGDARDWLAAQQNADGGFGAAGGEPSSLAMTGWASLGLEAAGINPLDVRRNGNSPISYLADRAAGLKSSGDLERTIIVVVGAGLDPSSFGGRDLVAELRARRRGDGSWEGQVNLTAYGILALRAAGAAGSELAGSAKWLQKAQNRNGGWGFAPGAASDPDSTGAVLEALAAAGAGGSGDAGKGVSYLRTTQRSDGGWALPTSSGSNSQSTALALQGLIAAGVGAGSVRSGGSSGLDYLFRLQDAAGNYDYSPTSGRTPVWVTAQAMMAVAGQTLPIAAVPRIPRAARSGESGDGAKSDAGGAAGKRSSKPKRQRGRSKAGMPGGVRTLSTAGGDAEPESTDDVESKVAVAVGDRGGSATAAIIVAALGLLAGGLLGGFLWFRRRLPEP